MIDRKTLWILLLLCLAMTAAAVWRLSLLPDWHHMPFSPPRARSPGTVWCCLFPRSACFSRLPSTSGGSG